nr:hypothetical protein OG409_00585 [Streptomyces sp. NBC_00974]WSX54251.1 hypothetical protein OG409_38330 [Streptomyces sp. NBC_00974]
MNTPSTVLLAGKLDGLGNSWLDMLGGWGDKGLKVILTVVVIVAIARNLSLKAGVGALLMMILALGLYAAREPISAMFTDEVNNPAKGAGSLTLVVTPPPRGHR